MDQNTSAIITNIVVLIAALGGAAIGALLVTVIHSVRKNAKIIERELKSCMSWLRK